MLTINNIWRKRLSWVLSLTVLFTSFGLQFDFHFCDDKLTDFAVFGKAKTCYEIAGIEAPVDIPSEKEEIDRKSCCDFLHLDCSIEGEYTKNPNLAPTELTSLFNFFFEIKKEKYFTKNLISSIDGKGVPDIELPCYWIEQSQLQVYLS